MSVVSGHKPISQRAYAKHRGCAVFAVQRAISDGRLNHSLTTNSRGHKKIISAEAADSEWEANTRKSGNAGQAGETYDDQEIEDDGISIAEASRRTQIEQWRIYKRKREGLDLDLKERTGELIAKEDAKAIMVSEYTIVKTALLGLPTQAKQRLPHLSTKDIKTIESLIREALGSLAGGK